MTSRNHTTTAISTERHTSAATARMIQPEFVNVKMRLPASLLCCGMGTPGVAAEVLPAWEPDAIIANQGDPTKDKDHELL